MKINVTEKLTDYAGVPLKLGTPDKSEEITVSHILIQVATLNPPPNKAYTPNEQVMRWHLGLNAYQARETPPHEMVIGKKMIEMIKDDVARSWGPMVAGQFLFKLGVLPYENKTTESDEDV